MKIGLQDVMRCVMLCNFYFTALSYEGFGNIYYNNNGFGYRYGACGFSTLWDSYAESPNPYFAAISPSLYNNGLNCGRCIEVMYINEDNNAVKNRIRTITMLVTDKCPECAEGDIDMNKEAYSALIGTTRFGNAKQIEWTFVSCPHEYDNENTEVYMKDISDPYYVLFQPRNSNTQVTSVEVIYNEKKVVLKSPKDTNVFGNYFLYDEEEPLIGPFTLRLVAEDNMMMETDHDHLWEPGTSVQLTESFHMNKNDTIDVTIAPATLAPTTELVQDSSLTNDTSDYSITTSSPTTVSDQESLSKDIEELIPIYGTGCNGFDKKCGDYNGFELRCASYGMCMCAQDNCFGPFNSTHVGQYYQCNENVICLGHGKACGIVNAKCNTIQEKLHCYPQKSVGGVVYYAQCLTPSECKMQANTFNCDAPYH